MWKGAIFASLVEFEEPDDGSKQNDRRLHKEVTLFLYPSAIKVEHDGVGRFVGIRDVGHKVGMNRITPVTSARIIKVDDIEFG